MRLSLRPETKQRIGEILQSGRYETSDDLVLAGLAALEQQERFGEFADGELDELLAAGERSIVEEGTIPATKVFDELRRRSVGSGISKVRLGKKP